MNQLIFDANTDPDQNFHFDDADPDPDWHQNDADPHAALPHVLKILENKNYFLLLL